jgi:hypothetical protein
LKLKINTSGFFAVAEAAVGLRNNKVIALCLNSVVELYFSFQTLITLELDGKSIGDKEVQYLANALRDNRVSSQPFNFSYTEVFSPNRH